MPTVLVVDDDPTVREVLSTYLADSGVDVCTAADGWEALVRLGERVPDAVVLDRMLPGLDGLEVLRRLRASVGDVGVIMLTARGELDDRILGLEVGADDYVTKPFSPREVVLRVHALLRRGQVGRSEAASTPTLTDGDLVLDLDARHLTRRGVGVPLTNREFELLAHFMRNPGKAFSRTDLLDQVWHWQHGDESTVTVHVRRLREKIEPDAAEPARIVTVWGVGYRWQRAEDAS